MPTRYRSTAPPSTPAPQLARSPSSAVLALCCAQTYTQLQGLGPPGAQRPPGSGCTAPSAAAGAQRPPPGRASHHGSAPRPATCHPPGQDSPSNHPDPPPRPAPARPRQPEQPPRPTTHHRVPFASAASQERNQRNLPRHRPFEAPVVLPDTHPPTAPRPAHHHHTRTRHPDPPPGRAGGVQGGTFTSEAKWSPPGRESPRERSVSRTPGGVGGRAPRLGNRQDLAPKARSQTGQRDHHTTARHPDPRPAPARRRERSVFRTPEGVGGDPRPPGRESPRERSISRTPGDVGEPPGWGTGKTSPRRPGARPDSATTTPRPGTQTRAHPAERAERLSDPGGCRGRPAPTRPREPERAEHLSDPGGCRRAPRLGPLSVPPPAESSAPAAPPGPRSHPCPAHPAPRPAP